MKTKPYPSGGNVRPRENEPTQSILLLERDPGLRKSITLSLRQNGIQVFEARNHTEALEILRHEPFALLILDQDSAIAGGHLIQAFREKSSQPVGNVMLISMERLEDRWRQQYQPDVVVYKPFDIRYLYRLIKNLLVMLQP